MFSTERGESIFLDDDAVGMIREALQEMNHDDSQYPDAELLAFWIICKRDIKRAAKGIIDSYTWMKDNPVTIADISAFYRAPPGAKNPPGCMYVLEDMKGDCARDSKGRPILVVQGANVHGTAEEIMMQLRYCMHRLSHYSCPDYGTYGCTHIIECSPRVRGEATCFGIPNSSQRAMMDAAKRYFASSQLAPVHFCGLSRIIAASFSIMKPILGKFVADNMYLQSNFSHLKKDGHVTVENLLPVWDKDGTFQFDLDEYVEWRAREEGADENQICPRGMGRQYQEDDSLVSAADLLDGEQAMKAMKVIKYGKCQKQGSGIGFFGTTRWKEKLMVVIPTALFYFDSQDITKQNKARRFIPLDPSCTVSVRDYDTTLIVVRVHAMARDFDFGFNNRDEATEWAKAIDHAFHSHEDGD